MYLTSDFKKGLIFLMDGVPHLILDFQHYKPGKGNQFTRTKLRNLISGAFVEKTIKSGEKFEIPDIEFRELNFLYKDPKGYHFMDQKNYEQCTLIQINQNKAYFLTENLSVKACFFNNKIIDLELPKIVELEVLETEPGRKGSSHSGNKTAKMNTGLNIQVPSHIQIGDRLRVNTQTHEYIERIRN